MRSVYQPFGTSIPQLLTTVEPLPWLFGGECKGPETMPPAVGMLPNRNNVVDRLLAPLVEHASRAKSRLRYSPVGEFHHGTCRYQLPRFVFQGPPSGGSTIRLGIFAASSVVGAASHYGLSALQTATAVTRQIIKTFSPAATPAR